jgi:hypothetical protein
MVLKSQPMSGEMAARVATQSAYQAEQEALLRSTIDSLQLRQWCVDKAITVCGTEGTNWIGKGEPPIGKTVVVLISEDILRFITGCGIEP